MTEEDTDINKIIDDILTKHKDKTEIIVKRLLNQLVINKIENITSMVYNNIKKQYKKKIDEHLYELLKSLKIKKSQIGAMEEYGHTIQLMYIIGTCKFMGTYNFLINCTNHNSGLCQYKYNNDCFVILDFEILYIANNSQSMVTEYNPKGKMYKTPMIIKDMDDMYICPDDYSEMSIDVINMINKQMGTKKYVICQDFYEFLKILAKEIGIALNNSIMPFVGKYGDIVLNEDFELLEYWDDAVKKCRYESGIEPDSEND